MTPAGKPRVWPIFVTFAGVFVGLQVLGGILLVVGAAVLSARTHPGSPSVPSPQEIEHLIRQVLSMPLVLAGTSAINATVFIATAFLACVLAGEPARERLRLHGTSAMAVVFGAIAFFASSHVLDCAVQLAGLDRFSLTLPLLGDAIKQLAQHSLALAILLIGVLPGLGEELFFRGFMQTRLVARWGRWPGILIAAACFGLMHCDPVHTPTAMVMGIMLGWLYERTGSLWVTVAAHALNNTLSTLQASGSFDVPLSLTAQLALSAVVAGGAVGLLWRDAPEITELVAS